MGITIILSLGGLFIVTSFMSMFLEHSGKATHAKSLDMVAILIGLTVIITSLAKLIGEVQSTFGVY